MTGKRADILNATLKLIARHDLEHTTMAMIAVEAGVGMGTIYNYFPSREALINTLYRELKQQLITEVLDKFTDARSLHEQFYHIWQNVFYYYLAHPEVFQFLEQYSHSPIITSETKAFGWMLWKIPIQILEEGRRQNLLKDLPVEMLLSIVNGPINNLVRAHISGQITLHEKHIEAAINACWDAIKI